MLEISLYVLFFDKPPTQARARIRTFEEAVIYKPLRNLYWVNATLAWVWKDCVRTPSLEQLLIIMHAVQRGRSRQQSQRPQLSQFCQAKHTATLVRTTYRKSPLFAHKPSLNVRSSPTLWGTIDLCITTLLAEDLLSAVNIGVICLLVHFNVVARCLCSHSLM